MNWHQHNQTNNPHMGGNQAAFDPYASPTTAADLVVIDRMEFIRRVYGWLMIAVGVAAAAATASFYFFITNISALVSVISPFVWIGIMMGSMIILGMIFARDQMKPQFATPALFIFAVIQGVIFGPLLAIAYFVAAPAAPAVAEGVAAPAGSFVIIWQGLILTGVVFAGLSAYVFLTKQDFSFMRGALTVMSMVFLGVILVYMVSLGFGWELGPGTSSYWIGMGISVFGILLASGYILYDTSQIMHKYTGAPGEEKLAAMNLLSDLALLLWYIIWFLIQMYVSGD